MCTIHVLTTPDFKKIFIVECDTIDNGIGAFLMQEGRPLSFERNQLKGKKLSQTHL